MINPRLFTLIEDDSDDQEIFRMALLDIHPESECVMAKDGLDGLEKLKRFRDQVPSFIFIDLNMPRMNGMECLVEIRRLASFNQSVITMYSTTSDSKIIKKALENGADDFLVKPSSLSALIDNLKELFIKYKISK